MYFFLSLDNITAHFHFTIKKMTSFSTATRIHFAHLPSYCVRGTRTQPVIFVGYSVHYWVSCAIYKGFFFQDCMFVVVDTNLPRFEALAYVLHHFDALTHVVILVSSAFIFQRFAEV